MSKRKRYKQEYNRLMEALAKATPGSAQYKELIDQVEALEKVQGVRKENAKIIPGVKNDTLALIGGTLLEIGLLAKLQDDHFLPKNLFSFFTKLKHQ